MGHSPWRRKEICIKEAGKVAQDGIDEVREAVDFCRYYAARAEELAQDKL